MFSGAETIASKWKHRMVSVGSFDVWRLRTRSAHIYTSKARAKLRFYSGIDEKFNFLPNKFFVGELSVASSKLNIHTKWRALNRWLLRKNSRQRNKLTEKRYVYWLHLLWCVGTEDLPLFWFVSISDVSTAAAGILLNGTPSFAVRIQSWQFTIERITNLHMAGCNVTRIDCPRTWCEPGDQTQRYLFWFCTRFAGPIWSWLSYARNRCHLFWPTERRRFAVNGTGKVQHRWLYGH